VELSNFPYVKALFNPSDFGNEYRCLEVERAIAEVLFSCDLKRGGSIVFLHLVEQLEKERKEMVLHHHGRIANLDAELKSTKANDSSRDAPQKGFSRQGANRGITQERDTILDQNSAETISSTQPSHIATYKSN
jgi:hypothetical protein